MGRGGLSPKALSLWLVAVPHCPSGPLVALVQGPYSTKKHRVTGESSKSGARLTPNASTASSELGDFR